jgi:hypothetical protein
LSNELGQLECVSRAADAGIAAFLAVKLRMLTLMECRKSPVKACDNLAKKVIGSDGLSN